MSALILVGESNTYTIVVILQYTAKIPTVKIAGFHCVHVPLCSWKSKMVEKGAETSSAYFYV